METSPMKNIVVLKNLPSNLVEEAIVIIKTNKVAKKLEERGIEVEVYKRNTKKAKEYMIREAESVISSYISKIEDNRNSNKIPKSNIEKKYKKLKIYSIIISTILLLSILI